MVILTIICVTLLTALILQSHCDKNVHVSLWLKMYGILQNAYNHFFHFFSHLRMDPVLQRSWDPSWTGCQLLNVVC